MSVSFDWTVKFGDILVIVGCLVTAGAFLFRKGGDLQRLEMAVTAALGEIGELKKEVKDMGKVLIELAVQKEQITMLTKWYDDLRRGNGWIPRSTRGSVDGEYP